MEELYEYRRRLIERYRAVADETVAAHVTGTSAGHDLGTKDNESGSKGIVAHLLEAEKSIFFPYLQKILAEDVPCLDQTRAVYEAQDDIERMSTPAVLLEKFLQLRAQQVNLLLSLPPESWSRCGRHSAHGTRTFQWWVERSIAHAEGHLRRGEA